MQTNVLGTHTLLECAKQYKIKRFIHVSTDEVRIQTAINSVGVVSVIARNNNKGEAVRSFS